MMAFPIKINVVNTPEQEIFMSFQCTILSAPIVERDNIQFKSQVIEFNGKKSDRNSYYMCLFHTWFENIKQINKLQKGNKMDVIGNLIKNDEEIVM